ncbi:MAG: FecR domain-containing protein [Elusimicrobia bacterium]|nr:FecR domain-containing protein [Elusimicrobiota bacterium]
MLNLLLALALPAFAAGEFHAKISSISGPVQIKALGHQNFTAATKGATLISGDSVKTGPGGIAHLELDGGAMLLVASGSTIVLGGEPEDPIVEFTLGEWLMGITKKLSGRRFRVKTPQAVAAVRGTLFWGKTDPKETVLAGLENEVEITAQGKTVVLKPDQLVAVPAGSAPKDPVPHKVPAPFLDHFRVDGGLAGVDVLLQPAKTKKPKKAKKQ